MAISVASEAIGFVKHEDGTVEYRVRDFNGFDALPVGNMVRGVINDPQVVAAMAGGNQNQIMLALGSSILEQFQRDVALLCLDFVGETKGYDLDAYERKERELAQEENRPMLPRSKVKERMEDDILGVLKHYPGGAIMDILTKIMEQPGFDDFLTSSYRLVTAAPTAFGALLNQSKNGSKRKTKKS